MIVGLGLVSLAIDMVADGAASVSGALLEQLGATALLVGLVTGGAQALALVLRLVTGPWADRTGAYWGFTIFGYALTAVSVPLLAFTPLLGAAGLAVASALLLVERTGKAIRSPSKTVLLADAARAVGLGKGFGVHKALDQIGAFAGPLVVAGVAAITGSLSPAFLVLIIPAVAAMVLLFWLGRRFPIRACIARRSRCRGRGRSPKSRCSRPSRRPTRGSRDRRTAAASARSGTRRIRRATFRTFLLFSLFAGLTTFGLLSYGIVSFHLVDGRARARRRGAAGVRAGHGGGRALGARDGLGLRPVGSARAVCRSGYDRVRARARRSVRRSDSSSPESSSGVPRPVCRTPRSRRSSPTSCPAAAAVRRTAGSPCSRASARSPAPSWPARCTPTCRCSCALVAVLQVAALVLLAIVLRTPLGRRAAR